MQFTIPAEKFPVHKHEVVLREPLFKDRRLAFERHPGRTASYTVQELILAHCLVSVNGSPVPEVRDVMENLKGLDHKDGQFLLSVFMSAITMTEEDEQRAKQICLQFSESNEEIVHISKDDMPSGEINLSFKLPSYSDQRDVRSMYPKSETESGYSMEELFFSSCLQSVNGQTINTRGHSANTIISILDDWPLIDIQFALTTFLSLTTLDQKENDIAADLGKSLRKRPQKPPSRSSGETPSSSSSRTKSKKVADTAST